MWYGSSKNRIFIRLLTGIPVALLIVCSAGCALRENPSADASTPASDVTTIPVIEIHDDTVDDALENTETEPSPEAPEEPDPDDFFRKEDISDELFERMQGKSWPEGCTMEREDLMYLSLLYKDADGNTHEGELICNKKIADTLIDIFRQLYDAGYPIEKMVLIDEYGGDDDASMSDNNTSCFNYRTVSGSNNLSKHAMGLAVDLNPRYNPYIHKVGGVESIEPENGKEYADRSGDFPYKIDKEDLAYKLFTQAGFTWGGSWKSVKDYQHFQYDK